MGASINLEKGDPKVVPSPPKAGPGHYSPQFSVNCKNFLDKEGGGVRYRPSWTPLDPPMIASIALPMID